MNSRFGPNTQAESGDDLLFGVIDRSDDKHRGDAGSRPAVLIGHDDVAGERRADGHLAFEGAAQKIFVFGDDPTEQFGAAARRGCACSLSTRI